MNLPTVVAPESLWAGPNLKLEYALFHYQRMIQVFMEEVDPVMEAAGAIPDRRVQLRVFAHFDAFLISVRSIPLIIECCFGHDDVLTRWLRALDQDERVRRQDFSRQFKSAYDIFADLPLTHARNVSVHRKGYPDVEIRVDGLNGVTYFGNAVTRIPLTDTPKHTDPNAPPPRPRPIEIRYDDFKFGGRSLFEACLEYQREAGDLIANGRVLAERIHGAKPLTPPP